MYLPLGEALKRTQVKFNQKISIRKDKILNYKDSKLTVDMHICNLELITPGLFVN